MSDIYTGIDLGTDSIKIVVTEKVNDKFYVLASVSSPSMGIKNGFIVDTKLAIGSVKNALRQVNEMLGIKITKVIAGIPAANCRMDIVVGSTNIIDYNDITGVDVSNVLLDAIKGQDFTNEELVTAMPISFTIDDSSNVSDPKGLKGSVLDARVVISTVDKEPLYRILEVLKLSGVETIDICYNSVGDYYSIKNKKYDELVGAIINIGEESTNVSVFNKGIQIKNKLLPIGSINVDKDIGYVFKSRSTESRAMKETFSVAISSYADTNDTWEIKLNKDEVKEVNQVGVSKVVEARIKEILKLAKNEIKNLTNREIRYIIITGGLSEMAGFQYLVEQEFGFVAKVCNLSTMGIRHNKYSSCYGITKYFDDKLELRGKHYNMVNKSDVETLLSTDSGITTNENMLSKVFGHF
ncbi:MAG: cell division protein FtsA, partial [Bacilli bacterium]|nr:cell division protein FtsA [Bacilli bacterium]